MARKFKKPRVYHFMVSRTPGKPWAVQFGTYDGQTVLDEMQCQFERARDRGEQIQFRCSHSWDDQASIDAAVANINEISEPMKVEDCAST